MNPIFQALLAAASSLLNGVLGAAVPALVGWFQKHVLPQSGKYQAMPADVLRAETRAWVTGLLADVGNALIKKGVVPVWLQPMLPALQTMLAQAINKALDDAGL